VVERAVPKPRKGGDERDIKSGSSTVDLLETGETTLGKTDPIFGSIFPVVTGMLKQSTGVAARMNWRRKVDPDVGIFCTPELFVDLFVDLAIASRN
jgi:hypothetical protein